MDLLDLLKRMMKMMKTFKKMLKKMLMKMIAFKTIVLLALLGLTIVKKKSRVNLLTALKKKIPIQLLQMIP